MTVARRRAMYGMLLLVTIPVGLAWRMVPMGLSPFFFKYGGSVLWAMALYWLAAMLMPRMSNGRLATICAAAAAALEFSRLWHLAALDAFRVTLAGRMLLGRYFAFKNIAAYWVAIGFAALVDQWMVRRARREGE
ncbi:MAG: DUF2809 domain-containing protein [Acidobacteriaceae bacterium]